MRMYLVAAAVLLLAAGTGCRSVNLAKGGCGCGNCACGGGGGPGHGGGGYGDPNSYGAGGYGGDGYGGDGHGGHGQYAGYPGAGPNGHVPGGHYGPHGGAYGTPGFPHHHFDREYVGPPGPPTAQVAYPYYTIRGPRDFLLDNPPSIGR